MSHSSSQWEDYSNLSDEEVWKRLRGGHHAALEYLYRTYAMALFNYGMKLYGKNEWVQDTLQDLFVDLWKQHQSLTAVKAVKTYLFKAFTYKLHRYCKKEKRWLYQMNYDRLPEMDVALPVEHTMIAEQLSREQKLRLASAMEKLPPRQKEVLHLLFEEEMQYEEVSQIMQINVRSVYTLAWKGISSLRKLVIDFLFVVVSSYISCFLV
ncbi:RNA polymerase sigma factor (sigma-70 family) [Catalinimonas alkaloidigena]|uniref:RNA polymerase sigma factor n=1 Tax=Catalinimonas alkaloidigena TaxID=1075417 RepID=UPI002406114F|nr:sigma-70 family RNA polymerase sigma factor [Catalinimonas alkaloidigena]MDF9799407.1 RNA polymerase sigma factor (sigma-70 family) [Catalinimonas alkaloidigena]